MGRLLRIVKIKEDNNIYYYGVSDRRYDNPTEFFIAIDALKKTVSYFFTLDCKIPITIIDFNVTSKIKPTPPFDKGLAESAFIRAGRQAYIAIRDNYFPEHIGKCS